MKSSNKSGLSKHPLRNIWKNILRRCENPKDKDFAYYGGRGIKVCKRWHKLENFIKDVEPRPDKTFTIDRIDVNGNYEPNNVKWSSKKEQIKNRRINHEDRKRMPNVRS